MKTGFLGKVYKDGEDIVRQGDSGNCMFVIQTGEAEVVREEHGQEVRLNVLGEKDFFGEVPLFERINKPGIVRSTVRALGEVRVLTIDKKTIVRRIHEDPSLAYRILQTMSRRVRDLESEVIRLIIGE